MKTTTSKLFTAGLALALPIFGAQAQIFTEDFQSGYSTGSLSGQNGWTVGFGASPTASATVEDASGNFFVSSSVNSYNMLDAGNFGLTSADTITLTVDLRVTASGANAMFGIGNFSTSSSSAGTPAVFGVQGGNWQVRGWGFGASTLARDTGGFAIAAPLNDWFRVQSTWDLSGTGTGTLAIMNLTQGETDFTQLYFNSGQDLATASLGLDNAFNPGVADWEGVFFRTENGAFDNITVIPEPQTYALLLGLLLGAAVLRRLRPGQPV